MNILDEANKIINMRSEEKERMYGPITEGIQKAADLAAIISNKNITADIMYICLIALKLSRQSYNYKEDNLLDAVAYMGAWQNHINEKSQKPRDPETGRFLKQNKTK